MPLDSQMQDILDMLDGLNIPPNETLTPEEAREWRKTRPIPQGPEVGKVSNVTVESEGVAIPVRIYQPTQDGTYPILVWFHGGGWVLGNIETADPVARRLCIEGKCVVMSVDYRLAPETKFPGAVEDCYAVTEWAAKQGHIYGGDPDKIAVGGDSAGGNLATVVSIMAARAEEGPKISFQMLIYPVTDYDFDTSSYNDNAKGYSLTKACMIWFWDHYLTGPEDSKDPRAVPIHDPNLSGLPPAIVITAEFDPLRDEGEAYGQKLLENDTPVIISRYDGVIHGFFSMAPALDKASIAIKEACDAMNQWM
ncbi:MAG: alpha/beta hydrolase [Dehalococcoidia bacterium]|nr:alpha/beta hydrolase [Dehalococcoidia bacterium]